MELYDQVYISEVVFMALVWRRLERRDGRLGVQL